MGESRWCESPERDRRRPRRAWIDLMDVMDLVRLVVLGALGQSGDESRIRGRKRASDGLDGVVRSEAERDRWRFTRWDASVNMHMRMRMRMRIRVRMSDERVSCVSKEMSGRRWNWEEEGKERATCSEWQRPAGGWEIIL